MFGIVIPEKPLSNFELERYVKQLKIPNFRGVFIRDTLPDKPRNAECRIVNFNTHDQSGSHWVCCYTKGQRIYFESFRQITPLEFQRYFETESEFERGQKVIQRNTDIVQAPNTVVCGHLCLYVLKALSSGREFQEILNGYQQSNWKDSVYAQEVVRTSETHIHRAI